MTAPYTTTATTLEGQILELAWQLKVAYQNLDGRNAELNRLDTEDLDPDLPTDNEARITIDPDLVGDKVTIRVNLDLTVVGIGEAIQIKSLGID